MLQQSVHLKKAQIYNHSKASLKEASSLCNKDRHLRIGRKQVMQRLVLITNDSL